MVCNGKQHGLQQYTDSWITTVYGPGITTGNARVSNVDYNSIRIHGLQPYTVHALQP